MFSVKDDHFYEQVVEELMAQKYAHIPHFWSDEEAHGIRKEIDHLSESFKKAEIGSMNQKLKDESVRSDQIYWFEKSKLSQIQAGIESQMESLKQALNQKLYLGLWDFEMHYAIYPVGSFYKTHLDLFQNSARKGPKRKISIVSYFNENWSENEGGVLLLEHLKPPVRVLPELGSLVIFESDQIPHQVTQTTRERYSLACWMRTRE